MTTLTFDTHAAIKVMKDSGLEEAHAESIVSAIQMSERHGEDLVTKAYMKAYMNTALENLEERVIARMTIRLGLMLFAVAGLAVAAAKFF